MSVPAIEAAVEGIEQVPGVCGGYPVIAGTRTSVRHVVQHLRVNGGGISELLRAFPHLRRKQVEAALVYYARCPKLVNEDIRRNQQTWEQLTGTTYDGHPVVPG
jgi:uncharacterized protein (DUF433 family)